MATADPTVSSPPPTPPTPLLAIEERLRLGIAHSTQDSPNWIGFADPTPHAAPLSMVEQPALDPLAANATQSGDEGQSGMGGAGGDAGTENVGESSAMGQSSPAQRSASRPQTQPPSRPERESQRLPSTEPVGKERPKLDRPDGPLRDGSDANRAASPAMPDEPDPASSGAQPTPSSPTVQATAPIKKSAPASDAPDQHSTPETPSMNEAEPSPAQATRSEQSTAGSPGPAGAPGAPGALNASAPLPNQHPGERSDRESDASSLKDTLVVLPGRPAAAQGLEIITKRPVFSKYVRTVASPDNPVYEVTFGRTGRVLKAVQIKSSGFQDVDDPVYNAVMGWRAKGQRLSEIGPGPDDGITLTIQIVLR